jgi:hypothetical protein
MSASDQDEDIDITATEELDIHVTPQGTHVTPQGATHVTPQGDHVTPQVEEGE